MSDQGRSRSPVPQGKDAQALRVEQLKDLSGRELTTVERAEALYELRRSRSIFFGDDADLFGEPAWDILLDLYIGQARGRMTTITDVSIASGAPMTTAMRWISLLERRGLLMKTRDVHDGRRTVLTLSGRGHEVMTLYLASC